MISVLSVIRRRVSQSGLYGLSGKERQSKALEPIFLGNGSYLKLSQEKRHAISLYIRFYWRVLPIKKPI